MKRGSRWTQWCRCTGRWGAVALAAFYLNFFTVHLATETHFHHEHTHHGEEQEHPHHHDHEHGHDHDDDAAGHVPHDASEHLLDVALKGADRVVAGPVLAIVWEIFVFDRPTLISITQPLFERERPPGESPPDAVQPRAPPLV